MGNEYREWPRYRVFLQVQLDGIELTANNISPGGMQISCPEFLIGRIEDSLNKESFDLDIQLPLIDPPCRVNAKMKYNSVFGDEHLIGIKYVDVDETHYSNLTKYLQGLADKNTPIEE
jgi:c-di-GMP-binding flagellar brake protein YcgR